MTVNASKNVTAKFKDNQIIIFGPAPTVIVGGKGTVSATGGASGNPVTFNSQTLDVCSVDGNVVTGIKAGACRIEANQSGNANYNSAPQVTQSFNVTLRFALSVSNANSTKGTVTSDTGGIACGATCSSNIVSGTSVKLTAIPIAGYQFSGWGGNCVGYGNSCMLTMDSAKSITANFEVFKRHHSIWKRALFMK